MCEKCHDTGYLNGAENLLTGDVLKIDPFRTINLATGEIKFYKDQLTPGEAARKFPYPTWSLFVQRCACAVETQATEKLSALKSTIPDDVKRFDSLETYAANNPNVENARQAISAAAAVLEGYEINIDGSERPGMLLTGGTGTGKSSLAYVIYSHFLKQGVSVAWLDYRDLVNSIRETYADTYKGQPLAGLCKPYANVSVLIIDELGSETRDKVMFEDLLEAMRLIFHPRYNERKVTIGTTNLSAARIRDQFGDLVHSRIRGNCHIIGLDGVDMRVGI